jgi:hypothetical protein
MNAVAKAQFAPPLEIVPEPLRQRLGWDWRHDEMAEQIISEFKLRLPRDRELIRQLALVREQQRELMLANKVRFCADRADRLGDKEASFILSIVNRNGYLSQKQGRWVDGIYHRLGGQSMSPVLLNIHSESNNSKTEYEAVEVRP